MDFQTNQRCEAVFSSCGSYRFWLSREWGVHAPLGVFLCHNPSSADALRLDVTTMNCSNLAAHWGWRGFGIVNLYPVIKSERKDARSQTIPSAICEGNDYWIRRGRKLADVFVIAAGEDAQQATIETLRRNEISGPFHAIERLTDGGFHHPAWVRVRKNADERRYCSPVAIQLDLTV